MRTKLTKGTFQCPACGTPVDGVTLGVKQTPSGYGLLLEDCGHVVTLELLRDAWGIEIPEPDPTRVKYAES